MRFTVGSSTWWIVLLLAATHYKVCLQLTKVKPRPSPKLEHLYRSKNLISTGSKRGLGLGQWGPWSDWSICSRSCGGGVSIQKRECVTDPDSSNRIDQFGPSTASGVTGGRGSSCVGHYKRYQFCHRKRCPGSESKDFRSEQCAAFNTKPFMGRYYQWEAFWLGPTTCQLKCRPKGERFYVTLAHQVIDGTPCILGVKDRVCVGGMCKSVGCDGVIGSDKKWDLCGVCGGDNSTCRIVSGLYTMPQLPYGYNLIATLPKGACNVNITELLPSRNYLALRYLNGSYILNGNWAINWSGNYEAVGTVFNYQREDEATKVESITAKGPTQDSVDMMILSQQTNPGVKYEYTLPLVDTSGSGRPTLIHSMHEKPFGETSRYHHGGHHRSQADGGKGSSRNSRHSISGKSGHGGGQHHHVRHQKRRGGKKTTPPTPTTSTAAAVVPPVITGLSNDNSPALRDVPADPNTRTADGDNKQPSSVDLQLETAVPLMDNEIDTNDTSFVWRTSGYTECSRSCGGGTQKNIVVCVKESNLAVVSDRHCRHHKEKIAVQTSRCNIRPCPPEWVANEWGDCSVTCGEGIQTRTVTCKQSLSANLQITVAENMCSEVRAEPTVRKCNLGPCFRWKVSEWDKCPVKCGKGFKRRTMTCVDIKGYAVSESMCDLTNRPSDEEPCEGASSCSITTWYHGDWSAQCLSDCGQGVQVRRVVCITNGTDSKHRCDPLTRPESSRVCSSERTCTQGRWFAGLWQPCSSPCGSGHQKREVICMVFYRGQYKVSVDAMCSSADKPNTEQSCSSGPCKPEWFTSEWTQCSQSCDTGNQLRDVKCLDEKLKTSPECEESIRPPLRQTCNVAKCHPENQGDSGCVDHYQHCRLVVQSRLCNYSYYRSICCDSCYKHR